MSGIKRSARGLKKLGRFFYTLYVYLLVGLTLIPLWVTLSFLPQKTSRKATQLWCRNFLRLIGCRLYLKGDKYLHRKQPMIYVANHMSYLDSIVLAGILPPDVLLVGKKELTKTPIVKKFIKELGYLTVDRMDFLESMSDTNHILTKLLEGNSILLFPEGTFSYATGLRPFKLGAFKIATETQSAICPIAIRGTRQVLRSNAMLLRPHKIHIWIGRPILPRSKDWREATRLRTVTRIEIAKHCGENLLDIVATVPAKD